VASCVWCIAPARERRAGKEEEAPVWDEEKNKALVRWWWEEVWVKGSVNAMDEFMAPNYVDHPNLPGLPPGPEGMKQALSTYRTAFPELQATLDDIFAAGDRVAHRWSARDTHLGEWLGVPPTGHHFTMSGITIYRLADGKAVEGWNSIEATPQLDGWEVTTYYEPAREVGGAFYDFLEFEVGRLGLVVGDATGKGMPAALVMATTRGMLRAVVQSLGSPGEVLARVNDALVTDIPPNMFVTCLYAILDPKSGSLRYANAGHDLSYLRHHGCDAEELMARGLPLGLMPNMRYEEKEAAPAPGDNALF
jgi:predicted ester cyclase